MIFYFSGCGNSRFVARELAAGLGDSLEFIFDVPSSGEIDVEGKVLGFVFPIYSWAAPALFDEFVLSRRWVGKPAYVWFACTYGDEMGRAYDLFEKVLGKVGLKLDAGYGFQMPETYLAMPGFHLDSKEGADAKIAAVREKLPSVVAAIKSRAEGLQGAIVGPLAWFKSYVIRPGFVASSSDKKYHLEGECSGCGLCAKVCPLGNITMVETQGDSGAADGGAGAAGTDGAAGAGCSGGAEQGNGTRRHPKWNGHCTQCMACYHHCPRNVIQIGSYTRGKGQYYFKD